jgi:hypothetical protein
MATKAKTDEMGYPPFRFKVLGRTLEHFGVQMYKRREIAIAELVANCWDAGATSVDIKLPDPRTYHPEKSRIVIFDSGCGMTKEEVQDSYLVLGRNRGEKAGWKHRPVYLSISAIKRHQRWRSGA